MADIIITMASLMVKVLAVVLIVASCILIYLIESQSVREEA